MADEAVCCSQFQTSSEPNASGCVCSLIGASRTRTFSRMVTTYIAAANSRQSPMLCRLLLIPAILGIAELMHGSASAARRRLAASLEQLAIQARRELPHELLRPLARAESDAHRLTSASVSGSSPKAATVSRYGATALQRCSLARGMPLLRRVTQCGCPGWLARSSVGEGLPAQVRAQRSQAAIRCDF